MTTIAFINASLSFESYLGSHIFDEISSGIRTACSESGIVCNFFDKRFRLSRLTGKTLKDIDGCIGIVPTNTADYHSWKRAGHVSPCVNIMIAPDDPKGNLVSTDERTAITLVLDHLCSRGHSTIGYIGVEREGFARERFHAYRDYLRGHGLAIRQDWVSGWNIVSAKASGTPIKWPYTVLRPLTAVDERLVPRLDAIIKARPRPSALVCETDYLALSFITHAKARGLAVPSDIAVTGIDNNLRLFPHYRNNMLTTAAQDFYALGRESVRLLDDIIRGKRGKFSQTVFVKPALVIRGSSGADSSDTEFRERVSARLEELLYEEKTAKRISSALKLNHKYFMDKFSRVFGTSFADYCTGLRLEHACKRLRETREEITEIAFALGFGSHQHFGRMFKRRFGMTPASFRAQKNATQSSPRQ